MDPASITALAIIIVALALLAVAAAAETALERASDARIHALAVRGDARARRLVGTSDDPRAFLGPLTAGRITFASAVLIAGTILGYGTIGDAAGILIVGAAAAVAILVVQLGVGVQAARRPEATALALSGPAHITSMAFMVPSAILTLPGLIAGRFLHPAAFDEPRDEDILSVIEREEAQGGVEELEQRMIRGVIKLEDTTAHEIMIPRIDIAAVDVEEGIEAVVPIVTERGFSRIPAYRDTIDEIVGIVYAKDILRVLNNGRGDVTLEDLAREPMFVPESKRLDELLTEMKLARTHMAIVVDEYGGTAGLVTIEDLLEEIVGEIEDEYDLGAPPIEQVSDSEVILDAGLPTSMLAEFFDYRVESEDFDTVGGFLIHELGRLPAVGDSVHVDGLVLRVLSMAGRRVRRVKIERVEPEPLDTTPEAEAS